MKLLLATRNEHKRREFARLLPDHDVSSLPAHVELPPEDGASYAENALGKARAAARACATLAFADDSGIEASALGGRPGVRSARYAGPDATDQQNLDKLLAEAPAGSALTYVCAIAIVDAASGEEHVIERRCEGTLAAAPAGDRGFGYDPAFVPDDRGDGLTMAQLADADKDAISHRGRAARALAAHLQVRAG